VLARYEKKYQPGKVLTGVFTRDFRKNEKDCQILVTVPECLEMLLLYMEDPGWHRRIKVSRKSERGASVSGCEM
jgi:ATP-dependent RNA helicase DDX60